MEARAVAVKMMNKDGGDQVVQRPELVDSDRAAQVRETNKSTVLLSDRIRKTLFTNEILQHSTEKRKEGSFGAS